MAAMRRTARQTSSLAARAGLECLESRTLLAGLGFEAGPISAGVSAAPVVFADFDGDLDVDFATTSGLQDDLLSVYFNDGTGAFTLDAAYDWGGGFFSTLASRMVAADFDNDGDIDVITNGPVLWSNDGDGTFTGPGAPLTAGLVADDMVVFNYDNNNLPDLAITEVNGPLVILVNGGGVFARGPEIGTDPNARLVTPGRVDVDARDDLLVYLPVDQKVRAFLNGVSGLSFGLDVNGVENLPFAADLNGDDFVDVAWVENSGDLAVSRNQANGTYAAEEDLRDASSGFEYTAILGLGDADEDGRMDLLAARDQSGTGSLSVLLGDGAGHFDGVEVVALGLSSGQAVGGGGIADVNGDGRFDVTHFAAGSLAARRSTLGPVIGTLTGTSGPIVPGENFTLSATALQQQLARPILGVSFYQDSNGNGRFDQDDRFYGTVGPNVLGASITAELQDSSEAGQVKFFAVAADNIGANSDVKEVTLTLWTRVYYPEGWRDIANVNEHVPMVNDNDFPVEYRVVLRYEVGVRDQVFETGVIPAHTRWGITTTVRNRPNDFATRPNEAYAIEVQTSAPIGAQLARYDTFGVDLEGPGTGETFTNVPSTTWAFADVSNRTLDFILFYNPHQTTAHATVTFYADNGQVRELFWTIEGFRRAGVAVQLETLLPANMDFSVVITSDRPIVAAQSRYSPGNGRGFTSLGQISGPSAVFDGLELRSGLDHITTLFNPGLADIEVTVSGSFEGSGQFTNTTFLLSAKQRRVVDLRAIAPGGATAGFFRVDRTLGVGDVVAFTETIDVNRRDSLATQPATFASKKWGFGDGFLDPAALGTRFFENIQIFNPQNFGQTVRVRFLFDDATERESSYFINANSGRILHLETDINLTTKPGLDWFSVVVEGEAALLATMIHWDLSQPGGWMTLGQALDSVVEIPGLT